MASSNHSDYSSFTNQLKNNNTIKSSTASVGYRLRPTSGMNHYLKGKLPDCFLTDNSPLVKKHGENSSNREKGGESLSMK